MSDFPAIPLDQKTEKNVKLFLDGLAGRMGVEGRAVTFQDLFDAGIIRLKPGVTLENIQTGTDPTDVVEVPAGTLPQNPTTPHSLGTAGSWGAIFLTWDYDAYNDEYGTEIWRSIVNDRSTASLIGVATGRNYTDNVGEKVSQFYWVRNRSKSNTVSGYNQLNGIVGGSNLITTAEDFILQNPDLDIVGNPFHTVNFGTVEIPDWKMLLLADVIIEGDLGIGQLTNGEMRPNTTFTVGNASVQIGTDINGLGYMIITGDGGITGNDYMYLNAGILQTFIYDSDIGDHVPYKELKRVESGSVNSGTQVVIPAYFKAEPIVQLSFEDLGVYNATYPGQDQSLKMKTGSIAPHPTVNGSYVFTPTATLLLAGNTSNTVEGLDSGDTSSDDDVVLQSSIIHNNGQQFVTQFTVSSAKNADGSNWQNREVLITMQGSLNAGAYSTLASKTVNLSGSGTPVTTTVDSGLQTQGTWQLKYIFNASDRAGTEPSGGASFTYEEFLNVTAGDIAIYSNDIGTPYVEFDIISTRPPPVDPAMKLYSIDYSATIDVLVEAWKLCIEGSCTTALRGDGVATYPINTTTSLTTDVVGGGFDGDAATGVCSEYPSTGELTYALDTDNRVIGTNGRIYFADDAEPYYSGKFSNTKVQLSGEEYDAGASCFKGYAKARAQIQSYSVDYYYRKPISINLIPINRFKVDSVSADLGATEVPVGLAKINWVAMGE